MHAAPVVRSMKRLRVLERIRRQKAEIEEMVLERTDDTQGSSCRRAATGLQVR